MIVEIENNIIGYCSENVRIGEVASITFKCTNGMDGGATGIVINIFEEKENIT
jgi:hypothetical protein